MKKIVFATNNKHKLDEIRKITTGRIEILSLSDINCNEDIEETGTTLEENALIKVRYVKNKYGYDCFGDDTGLEVEALNGEPGVYSSRYAGAQCDPQDNMNKLISALQGADNRNAQFRTVIAATLNDKEHLFEGVVKGHITTEKHGSNGFGYDPIFMPSGYNQTFGELSDEVKNGISHRAVAMEKFIAFLGIE